MAIIRQLNDDIIVIMADTGGANLTVMNADVPCALEVIDFWAIGEGSGAADTVKLTDGTNDITNALDMSTDKGVVRASTIDDAYSSIAAGGTLALVVASACPAKCFIMCQKVNP
jgi:hypothetical protein